MRAVAGRGNELGMATTAEGVETEAQLARDAMADTRASVQRDAA